MESGAGAEPPAGAVRPTRADPVAPLGRRRGGAHPSGVRAVRGVRRRAGLARVPAGGVPSAGGGLGSADRMRRRAVSAHAAGASPAPGRRPDWLHRRVH